MTTGINNWQKRATRRHGIAHGRIKPAVCLFATLLMGITQADEALQSQEGMLESARNFLDAQVAANPKDSTEIVLGHFDPRLRLKACGDALEPFLPDGSKLQGKLNVGIRCPGAWTVYLSTEIKVFSEVLVAARPLSRGETLRAGDTLSRRMEVSKMNSDYYQRTADVDGKILKRSVPEGRPLTANMLRAPLLVRRGDAVTIIAAGAGLQVRMKGKALQDAAYGERVSVENLRSKRIVEGTAVKSGQVQVFM